MILATLPLPRTRQARRQSAMAHIASGAMRIRKAAAWSGIAYSTLQSALQGQRDIRKAAAGRPRALNPHEELLVLGLLKKLAEEGTPLSNEYVAEAVAVIGSFISPARRLSLPFKDERPGAKWLRGFRTRYKSQIAFTKPTRQESLRFSACRGEVLSEHFAKLEKLMQEHRIDTDRHFNLDECGVTPQNEISGYSQRKRYNPRQAPTDAQVARFAYQDRINLMPAISASGAVAPCLFVLKGKRIPYKMYQRDGRVVTESPLDKLPRGAVMAMRTQLGGVD